MIRELSRVTVAAPPPVPPLPPLPPTTRDALKPRVTL